MQGFEPDSLECVMERVESGPELRGLTRSALGPVAGESSSDSGGAEQDSLNQTPDRNFSRSSYVIEPAGGEDDLDDEITAVFEARDEEDPLSRSWHGSRSSSQRSLAFFVDLSASGPPPPSETRTLRRVSSARTATSNCSFFVELEESADQLARLSTDMRARSTSLLTRNIRHSKTFFSKLKAFIDFLNTPNYSKEEVRQKRQLADRITRVMLEEEQRLRRGLELTELSQLDRLLATKSIRPTSAYAAMQTERPTRQPPAAPATTAAPPPNPRPVLRRERTFDLEHSSLASKKLQAAKRQNRKSMPVSLTASQEEAGPGHAGRKEQESVKGRKDGQEAGRDTVPGQGWVTEPEQPANGGEPR